LQRQACYSQAADRQALNSIGNLGNANILAEYVSDLDPERPLFDDIDVEMNDREC
jgi:hypothetical protein